MATGYVGKITSDIKIAVTNDGQKAAETTKDAATQVVDYYNYVKQGWTTAPTKLKGAEHVFIALIDPEVVDAIGNDWGWLEEKGIVKDKVKPYSSPVSPELTRGTRLDPTDITAYAALKAQGFEAIVNLCSENDSDTVPAKAAGLEALHIAVRDDTAPSLAQVVTFLNFVKAHHPCYVHCEEGIGRTGVFAACYELAVLHKPLKDVVANARAVGMAIPEQIKFIYDFAAALNVPGAVPGYSAR